MIDLAYAGKLVGVAVSGSSVTFDRIFTYEVPFEMGDLAQIGCRVIIPFGAGNRKRTGIILTIENATERSVKCKPLLSVIDVEPVLNDEMVAMVHFLKENTFCTYFDAVKTILPSGMNINISQKYLLVQDFDYESVGLTDEESNILSFLIMAKCRKEFDAILDCSDDLAKRKIVESLLEKGIIKEFSEAKAKINDSRVKMLKLSQMYLSEEKVFKLTAKQKTVVNFLVENQSSSIKEILYSCNVTKLVVNNLIKLGAVEAFEYENFRSDYANSVALKSPQDIVLSNEQKSAYEHIEQYIDKKQARVCLLHGVTGSGKTAVFVKLIERVVADGRQAILLIPEIALTPQIVKRFQELFGSSVAVIHSSLPLSHRLDEYKRIKQGKADIVIGTRSAVFAPLNNIGIIIMDEEGEHSYKSDSSPRYHTSVVAKVRCKTHNSVLILASATPTIESYYYAQRGIYDLVELKERFNSTSVPQVQIIDMNEERGNHNFSNFSETLVKEINLNIEKGEQTILLLNRRGYHTFISCCDCQKPIYCPNCSIPMTYHKANGQLMCHYCGFSQDNVSKCPECNSERLKQMGFGTQKIEEELKTLFPDARVLRMDADTTFSRFAYENSFRDFEDGKYDIMIGTQMIGKGLDFPNVTLVGVLTVDKSLFSGDFRSYERTFSLVTQVVGRSGRGDKLGRAYLQTFMPDHYVLNLSAEQDYRKFYDEEIALRKALTYPPVCDICVIGISSTLELKAKLAADCFMEILRAYLNSHEVSFPLRVLGPAKFTYGKINGKFRFRIILKCKNVIAFRDMISELLIKAGAKREFANVQIYADINGDI